MRNINWKKLIIEAIAGFTGWTIGLTPYMLFVVRTSSTQYFAWVVMELILVTPLAPVVIRFTNWICKKVGVIS